MKSGEYIHYLKADNEMYSAMGKHFASPKIRKEIGWPLEDDGFSWVLFLPYGFASYEIKYGVKINIFQVQDIYVFPEYRNKGWCKKVLFHFDALAKENNCVEMRATCNKNSIDIFSKHGYQITKPGKGWTKMRRFT